jgi:hypothetical protein
VETRVAALRERAEADGRVSVMLTVSSMERHAADLRQQLRSAMLERAKEVVTLRLIGGRATAGRIPLTLLSSISQTLSDSVAAATERVRRGRVVHRVTRGMREAVNLQLADLVEGSTVLAITGETAPDIFGHSSLAEAIEETFGLLESTGQDDDLTSRVAIVGVRAAQRLGEFLGALAGSGLAVEVQWHAPAGEVRVWKGTPDSMIRVQRELAGFSREETHEVSVTGRALTLSLRGRFELEADGRTYTGSFPSELQSDVMKVRLGEEVSATIQRSVVTNNLMQSRREAFTLISIRPSGQMEIDT